MPALLKRLAGRVGYGSDATRRRSCIAWPAGIAASSHSPHVVTRAPARCKLTGGLQRIRSANGPGDLYCPRRCPVDND
jgi:hypothetical protein